MITPAHQSEGSGQGGGAGPLMANAILNFHFDFLNTSLSGTSATTLALTNQL